MPSLTRIVNGAKRLGDGLNHTRDDTYLSYYDVTLKRVDVDSIRHDDWLTDTAIEFWQEYLEREELSAYPKARIVLLRPSMSFLLRQTSDPLSLKDALPNFSKTTHIFLPINDNNDVEALEGGSHWSLLLVSLIDGVSFHYDSMSNENDREARNTTTKLEILVGKRLKYIPMVDSPQQDNGYDCGVIVCILMQHLLLKRLLKVDAKSKISMSVKESTIRAKEGRRAMMRVLEERRKEAERRRSRSRSPLRPKSAHSKSPPRIGDENDDLKTT